MRVQRQGHDNAKVDSISDLLTTVSASQPAGKIRRARRPPGRLPGPGHRRPGGEPLQRRRQRRLVDGSLDAAGLAAISKTGTTQLRVYFAIDNDNNRRADYIGYYAGDNSTSASRPQLVVTYQ